LLNLRPDGVLYQERSRVPLIESEYGPTGDGTSHVILFGRILCEQSNETAWGVWVMKSIFTVGLGLLLILGVARTEGTVFAAEIADMAWDESNISTLRSLDKDAVFGFVEQTKTPDANVIKMNMNLDQDSRSIEAFTWADLAGDHHYELVVAFTPPGTSLSNIAVIYRRSSSGQLATEVIEGDGITIDGSPYIQSPKLIQDLDGDGKYELVVPEEWGSALATSLPIYLKIYSLSGGSYVEASRNFPKFYDTQVLPMLETEISEAANEPPRNGPAPSELTTPMQIEDWRDEPVRKLASLEMKRDKILRVLGRDSTAGEKEARKWVKSGDPQLIEDAMSVFEDMGGHEAERQEAKEALRGTK
jgi:hypothetical protein